MSNEYLTRLAEELKEVRKKKKITIDQIFTKTRIDKKYLSAIEEGNFSIMPEVYIRAFIKEYSKTVGLKPDEILAKYEKAKDGENYLESNKEEIVQEDNSNQSIESKINHAAQFDINQETTEKIKSNNKPLYYLLGAISMLLTIFIIYQIFLNNNNTEIITEKPFDKIIEEQNSNKSQSDEIVETDSTQSENSNLDVSSKINENYNNLTTKEIKDYNQPLTPGELTLTIIGISNSWMRVVSDDKNNVEFIIEEGIAKVISAKEKFYLHIGNSGGVKLLLNNESLAFSGSPGKVRKIFITENGIEYLRRTPKMNVE